MVDDNGNDAGDAHVDDYDDNERYAVMIFLPSGQIILISEARRTTRRALKQMASFIVINHDNGLPAYSHHDKIPPWWEYVSNDKGGNVSVTKSHHT